MELTALFVEPDSIYRELGLDCWDEARDARGYGGPNKTIAHPPCERWGRYWHGGPSVGTRRIKGHDGGCFAVALWAVRSFGGVLEHPEASWAWAWHGLEKPKRSGGWTELDQFGGRSCCVEQGHYGHRARKATWLYSVGCEPKKLIWGPSSGVRLDAGYHSAEERKADPNRGQRDTGRLTVRERIHTPRPFAEMLIDLCRTK